jgi:hypothetical protein
MRLCCVARGLGRNGTAHGSIFMLSAPGFRARADSMHVAALIHELNQALVAQTEAAAAWQLRAGVVAQARLRMLGQTGIVALAVGAAV